jgi:hypothetical protein
MGLSALLVCASLSTLAASARAEGAEHEEPQGSELGPRRGAAKPLALLPIRFTAFGDLYWSHDSTERDGFHIGSLELDVGLELTPFVSVFVAMPYVPERDTMGLAAFTVDNGLFGSDAHALLKSEVIDASGLVIGKFDVPFGIAYLEYASTDNRVVTQPRTVLETHGAWNDIGGQAYVTTRYANAVAFMVDGSGLPQTSAAPADFALGARVGLTPLGGVDCDCSVQLGASLSRSFGDPGTRLTLRGLDLSATAGFLSFKNELIDLQLEDSSAAKRGFYSEARAHADLFVLSARHDVVLTDDTITQRELTFGVGREVITEGEVRVVYRQGLETSERAVFVQIVGGSRWQPTGLRR